MSVTIRIQAGRFALSGHTVDAAPQSVAWFLDRLPWSGSLIHVRWSGEAVWMPIGADRIELGYENHTAHPSIGDVLLHPGGFSEAELLIAYGGCSFASRMGPLAGNHFLTLDAPRETLAALGHAVLWEGAQAVQFGRG
jgi:hypothetical protein